MEKAVGALRVLQTFWSGNELQQNEHPDSTQAPSALQASPVVEGSSTKSPWNHQTVKVEEEEGRPLSGEDNQVQQTSESRNREQSPARIPLDLTRQNLDNTSRRASSLLAAHESERGSRDIRSPDVAYTDPSFAMSEANADTGASPHIHSPSKDVIQVSTTAPDDRSGQIHVEPPAELQCDPTDGNTPKADGRITSDDEIRNQPDVIFGDESLIMPLDGPHLREVIHKIERDGSLCFKMRWFVARHVRQQYQADLTPSTQLYRRRVNRNHTFTALDEGSEQLVSLRQKPFNRLDFEATRLQEQFFRHQPGWRTRRITQILQKAYEQYRWEQVITDDTVDGVLVFQAGVDPAIFHKAKRLDHPRQLTFQDVRSTRKTSLVPAGADTGKRHSLNTITQRVSQSPRIPLQTQKVSADADAASYTSIPPPSHTPTYSRRRVGSIEPGPSSQASTSNNDEIEKLRAEIRELRAEVEMGREFREKFAEEQKASQEALMAEMRMMLEAAECGRKRKRSNSDKKQLSRRKSRKMQKYVQKLKELDGQTDGSLSSSSPADDLLSDSE